MKKLLVQYPITEEQRQKLEALCSGRWEIVIIPSARKIKEGDLAELLPDTEVIFGDIPAAWLENAAALRWMQISWAGVRPYIGTDLPDRVLLTNASGAFGVTIAEHAIGMLLTLARNFRQYYRNAETGLWKDAGSEWSLEGKQALLLGTGDIGSAVARRLKGFGIKTVGFCRSAREAQPPFDRMITAGKLEEELPQADMIFGALPETPETVHLLNEERLSLIKEDAILVNAGRGSLIDPQALVRQLEKGRFYGVGLDVTEPEPLPADHPLHVAGIGFGHLQKTTDRIWEIALDNLERYQAGKPLRNIITNEKGY